MPRMSPKSEAARPLEHSKLAKREQLAAEGELKNATVPLLDVSLKEVKASRIIQEGGRLRVLAELDGRGIRSPRYERIPAIRLSAKDVHPQLKTRRIEGYRPSGLPTKFMPKRSRPTHQLRPQKGEHLDRGGTIFGNDDRYLFQDTSFPWCTTGKVKTAGKWGSGTTIGPRHVLTASHVVDWTLDSSGAVAGLTFTPGYFDGAGPWGEFASAQVVYWEQAPGSLSDEQTAFDYVVLIMQERVGDIVGYPGFRAYDDDWNGGAFWQYTGYPGELASGERPAFQGDGVISTAEEKSLSGQTGYVLGHFNEFTPGQSGGAVWGWWGDEPWPRVVGVGSTIGSTEVKQPTGSTTGDNEYGGGPALSSLIAWARDNFP
jgi:V8-like Glu-specific endopeptidase